MKVRYTLAAQAELRDAVRWYNAQRKGLGEELRSEVRAAIRRIKQHPLGWQVIDGDVRRYQTHRFPYGVIYQVRNREVLIVAVAHLHREPLYWRDRLG